MQGIASARMLSCSHRRPLGRLSFLPRHGFWGLAWTGLRLPQKFLSSDASVEGFLGGLARLQQIIVNHAPPSQSFYLSSALSDTFPFSSLHSRRIGSIIPIRPFFFF